MKKKKQSIKDQIFTEKTVIMMECRENYGSNCKQLKKRCQKYFNEYKISFSNSNSINGHLPVRIAMPVNCSNNKKKMQMRKTPIHIEIRQYLRQTASWKRKLNISHKSLRNQPFCCSGSTKRIFFLKKNETNIGDCIYFIGLSVGSNNDEETEEKKVGEKCQNRA